MAIYQEFTEACFGGDKLAVMLMISKGEKDFTRGLIYACKGGHKDIALMLIKMGADVKNFGLASACYNGHRELALLLIENGAIIKNVITLDNLELEYFVKKCSNVTSKSDLYHEKIRIIKIVIQTMLQIIKKKIPDDLAILCISY